MLTKFTTPQHIHAFVNELVTKIDTGTNPAYLPVKPDAGAQLGECFFNVRRKISKDGGQLQHGWCVWELPGLYIEGEFHGVWVCPTGEMIDVSPKHEGELRILFLPDNERYFDEIEFSRRDNIRIPINKSPVVKEFISHCENLYQYELAGIDPQNPRMFRVNPDRHRWYLQRKRELTFQMLSLPIGRNDMCRCGSAKKFKKCCGKE